MSPKIAVLCWEQNRPWVSTLRQRGYSVPWVEEPKGDLYRQIPGVEPDLLLVDLTREADRTKQMVAELGQVLKGVPMVLVSEKNNAARGLRGKVQKFVVTTPAKIISTVRSALAAP